MITEPGWLDYRVRWRTGETRPGRHMARQAGTGGALRGYRPFWQMPDARRIDVRRSIMDPSGSLMVRQMEHRGTITVIVAADVSRSMLAHAGSSKLGCVQALVHVASRSANRAGDAFGFLAFDSTVRRTMAVQPGRARGPALALQQMLAEFVPEGRNADGVTELAAHLPQRRCLVLLMSDFLFPAATLQGALESLARHDVAPIILHDPQERDFPATGLVRLSDAETGRMRLMLMRPGLRASAAAQAQLRQSQLDALFLRLCRPGFHVHGALDVTALGQHLLQG